MDKNTLANYGWVVCTIIILAIIISLATPFGSVIRGEVEKAVNHLKGDSENALEGVGSDTSFDDINGSDDPDGIGGEDVYDHNAPELHPVGNVPDGAYYANLSTALFFTEMPSNVSEQDIYLYGDYYYCYESRGWTVHLATASSQAAIVAPDYTFVDLEQTSYGPILESINGAPVIALNETFKGCTSLEVAPAVPQLVSTINNAFDGCVSLTDTIKLPCCFMNTFETDPNLLGANCPVSVEFYNCFDADADGVCDSCRSQVS